MKKLSFQWHEDNNDDAGRYFACNRDIYEEREREHTGKSLWP
jgi:hypothetical protein